MHIPQSRHSHLFAPPLLANSLTQSCVPATIRAAPCLARCILRLVDSIALILPFTLTTCLLDSKRTAGVNLGAAFSQGTGESPGGFLIHIENGVCLY